MAWPKGKGRKLSARKHRAVMNRIKKGIDANKIAAFAGVTATYIRYLKRKGA